jgi:hypothetical protein
MIRIPGVQASRPKLPSKRDAALLGSFALDPLRYPVSKRGQNARNGGRQAVVYSCVKPISYAGYAAMILDIRHPIITTKLFIVKTL